MANKKSERSDRIEKGGQAMVIFRFDPNVGQEITQHGSVGVTLSRILHVTREAYIRCFHLSAGGVVGYHQALTPQLFLVVNGTGWVRDESNTRFIIQVGQAAFCAKGEWHESGTADGMMAIVVEGENLDPQKFMTREMKS
jgi:quercetin dioxygenase-like cupin family protein